MTARRVPRLAAATVLAAAAVGVLPAGPAAAATCSSDTGVSVVVDFSALGGGVAATCVTDGGGDTAGTVFEVDHDLTRVSQFPGAVCRVDGTPADAQCERMPPTDAYWGLFWSDGSGGWVYSSEGVDDLTVPDGGSVAFAWQDGGDREEPGVAPPQHAEDAPSPSPSQGGGSDGDSGGGTGGSSPSTPSSGPSGSAGPSASPTASPADAGERHRRKDGRAEQRERRQQGRGDGGRTEATGEAVPGDDPSVPADPSDAVPTADPADAGADALPAWVAPVGIAALFGVAGAVALLRRRAAAR